MVGASKLQRIDAIPSKSPTKAIRSDVRKEIVERLVTHGDTLRRVARHNGIHEDDALDVLIGEMRRDAAVREQRAFLKGQRSMQPWFPPAAGKRAA